MKANADPGPTHVMTKPPATAPTILARDLTLTNRALASCRRASGTMLRSNCCQDGNRSALHVPPRNVASANHAGVSQPMMSRKATPFHTAM